MEKERMWETTRTWRVKRPNSIKDLVRLLTFYNIPVEKYGKGEAKTTQALYEEVEKGESFFAIEDAKLIRLVSVVCLFVYQSNRVLVEYKQIFPDGRERFRKIDSSAGEKMMPGETADDTLEALIFEELPALQKISAHPIEVRVDRKDESQSYPGLPTIYKKFFFKMNVPESVCVPLVVHEADGKEVHYRWETVSIR